MRQYRVAVAALIGLFVIASPASAQIYYKPPSFSAAPLTGLDASFDPAMPGASAAEEKAALTWSLRSALNLAALQCQFEPMLRTVENYNAILGNHSDELAGAFSTISNYYKRTKKAPKLAQTALDQYGTRVISSYSTVRGQIGFCYMAGQIGRRALFTPRGSLGALASERLGGLRLALKPAGEQQFTRPYIGPGLTRLKLPPMEDKCWDKKGHFVQKKCAA
jgi:hypothetical protein